MDCKSFLILTYILRTSAFNSLVLLFVFKSKYSLIIQVSPELYGDTRNHLFIFWKTKNGGCFNLLCPGFVQISSSHPVDLVLDPKLGEKLEIELHMYMDLITNVWWLELGDGTRVGYWPSGLLPELGNSASYGGNFIAWGGFAKGLPNGPSPLMGNGNVLATEQERAAYIRQLKIADSTHVWLNPREAELERYVDNNCYGLVYHGYKKGAMGHNILYGGAGGNCGP
ncbi:hypothetical protein AQUCO_02600406v1 [Aquilegia coerulea]|uniref:Neprosin PEP catalytic domain-containing protein n=1 Tax=Aquilegia coerulea TaxID=218851 RepID=A0A2G5D8U9_AQUCA|nr:hypothetical protein AQUCO_02600406v1 [Aquilegia coerulea]